MIFVVIIGKNEGKGFFRDVNELVSDRVEVIGMIVGGYVIRVNWGRFIWGVCNGEVLECRLG